jgi:hypothetical protein
MGTDYIALLLCLKYLFLVTGFIISDCKYDAVISFFSGPLLQWNTAPIFPLSYIAVYHSFYLFVFVFAEEESETAVAATTVDKAEVDVRSIYVGNVSFLLLYLLS